MALTLMRATILPLPPPPPTNATPGTPAAKAAATTTTTAPLDLWDVILPPPTLALDVHPPPPPPPPAKAGVAPKLTPPNTSLVTHLMTMLRSKNTSPSRSRFQGPWSKKDQGP